MNVCFTSSTYFIVNDWVLVSSMLFPINFLYYKLIKILKNENSFWHIMLSCAGQFLIFRKSYRKYNE